MSLISAPKYFIYGFNSKQNHMKFHSDIPGANKNARLISFETHEEPEYIEFYLEIFGVGTLSDQKCLCTFTNRTVHFTASGLFGDNVHFITPPLLHEIEPSKSSFEITDMDNVKIIVHRKEIFTWKGIFFFNPPSVKKKWQTIMKNFLMALDFVKKEMSESHLEYILDKIWEHIQFLCIDDLHFYLHAIQPYGPIGGLGGARTIDDVIGSVMNSFRHKFDLCFMKGYFLGAAFLHKLKVEKSDLYAEVQSVNNEISMGPPIRRPRSMEQDFTDKKTADLLKVKGNFHYRNGDFEEANQYYDQAIQKYPDCPIYYCNRAASYISLKLYEKSFVDAMKALDLDPFHIKGFYQAGKALMLLGLPGLAFPITEIAKNFDQHDSKSELSNMIHTLNLESTKEKTKTDKYNVDDIFDSCLDTMNSLLPNFNALVTINKLFSEQKMVEVKQNCRKLLCSPHATVVANSCYYLSYASVNLDERYEADYYIDKCLRRKEDHVKARKLLEEIKEFYCTKDLAFADFLENKQMNCIEWYKKGLKIDVHNDMFLSHFHFLIGLSYKSLKRIEDAIESFTLAIKYQSNNFMAYFMRSQCYNVPNNKFFNKSLGQRDLRNAIKHRNVPKYDHGFVSSSSTKSKLELLNYYNDIGQKHFMASRFKEAVHYYRMACLCSPNDPLLYCQYSVCLRILGKYDDALKLCSKAIKVDNSCGYAYFEKGKILLCLGRINDMHDTFENAIGILQDNPDVITEITLADRVTNFIRKGKSAMEDNRYRMARYYYTIVSLIATEFVQIKQLISACNFHIANNEENLTKIAITADYLCYLGGSAQLEGNTQEALMQYRKALKLDPNNEEAMVFVTLFDNVSSLCDQGDAALKKGKYVTARNFYLQVLSIDSANTLIQAKSDYCLGGFFLSVQDYEPAIIELTKAIESDNSFAEAYLHRAHCYDKLKKYKKAYLDYRRNLCLNPTQSNLQLLEKVKEKIILGQKKRLKY